MSDVQELRARLSPLYDAHQKTRWEIHESVSKAVIPTIRHRPVTADVESDKAMLFPVVDAMVNLLMSARDDELAIGIFEEAHWEVIRYEQKHRVRVYKADLLAMGGLTYLTTGDFTSAMHFLEMAQEEYRSATGDDMMLTWDLDFFFWHNYRFADLLYGPKPRLYSGLWGTLLSVESLRDDWQRLTSESRLNYIVNVAHYAALLRLAERSGRDHSISLGVGYWNLAGDFARLLETETKRHAALPAPKPYQLWSLLTQGFTASKLGNLSSRIVALGAMHGINNTSKFNAQFAALRQQIEDATASTLDRVAAALYLLYATRNQVQHHVDETMILFTQPDAAIFTLDTLLALCKLDGWAT